MNMPKFTADIPLFDSSKFYIRYSITKVSSNDIAPQMLESDDCIKCGRTGNIAICNRCCHQTHGRHCNWDPIFEDCCPDILNVPNGNIPL